MNITCPICKKRVKASSCRHSSLLNYGYYQTDGKFYLARSKGVLKEAEKLGLDITEFFEPL